VRAEVATGSRRSSRMVAVGLAAALAAAGSAGVATPAWAGSTPSQSMDVIVRTASVADSAAAQAAVRHAGGTVSRPLNLISGFTARVPSDAVAALRQTPGVTAVTLDGSVRLKGDQWSYNAGNDSSVQSIDWSSRGWNGSGSSNTSTLTGAGVGVALIDSGVAPVAGLSQPGKVINGPDLSFESQNPALANIDSFGHGTHMAGIIAGNDTTTRAGAPKFTGIAPGANLISLKVAAANGATDVSQVIAAIDWVVAHRSDPGLNIRVLNLSFGTDSTQDPKLDPLSYAVEAAWRKGIVVVVSVGNDGVSATRVTMPAANPYVIAVGAADAHGTTARTDDSVAPYSSRGSSTRHADVLAAGSSVVSLRTPGSFIDETHPVARVADAAGNVRFFRGSGTSQAAAVVSGTVALLLQQRPSLTPNQVKKALMQTADPVSGADPIAQGAGQINLARAAAQYPPSAYTSTQSFAAATGLGTLEGARGTAHVVDDATGNTLSGEKDIFGAAWTPRTWTVAAKAGTAWSGGTWNGTMWTGAGFTGTSWASKTWLVMPWTAQNWAGRAWTDSVWAGRAWTAGAWTGRSWTTGMWCGRAWTGRVWG
jgi:serine protease AprX